MRIASGIALWIAATVIGLMSAASFSLAGLAWADGSFFIRGYWEENEGEIGVGFAIFGLVTWVVLVIMSFVTLRGGPTAPSRGARVASVVLTMISVMAVVTLVGLAIGWPEPASEYPLPPWNRA